MQHTSVNCKLICFLWLKVLKRYHALWGMNRVKTRRPNLYIVNLQVRLTHLDNTGILVDDTLDIIL